MRLAAHEDIGYFVNAGREFAKNTPYSFDEDSYTRLVHEVIKNPQYLVIVDGDSTQCHCAAMLAPSIYNVDEIVARVFTTWGPGGLNCFREVETLAKEEGAKFIIADSFTEPRMMKFYERNGMKPADTVFIKEL